MIPEEILHMTIDSLIKTNEQQARQLEEMSVRIKELTAQLAWFQRRMFGRSSEKRMMLEGQLTLFDNTEERPSSTSMEEDGIEEKNERAVISRKGRHRSRENRENLPVLETVVHEPENIDLERYRRIGCIVCRKAFSIDSGETRLKNRLNVSCDGTPTYSSRRYSFNKFSQDSPTSTISSHCLAPHKIPMNVMNMILDDG